MVILYMNVQLVLEIQKNDAWKKYKVQHPCAQHLDKQNQKGPELFLLFFLPQKDKDVCMFPQLPKFRKKLFTLVLIFFKILIILRVELKLRIRNQKTQHKRLKNLPL